ncbi:D-3-phosphoglycerate dehydrogenase [Microdochium bolleyi]|uniref:D-3-phosphoglycerate dehydrogenase n=1 Tax=Microdochium bolleyi TaxID=196109 RepID=A0A136JG92_9PEZI|nr:D-3-phosphoglycerate dehydrogenase [Microdochium bolleyi]
MAPVQVAVLDDYQEISPEHFAALDSAKYEVTTFSDTLLPYNHPEATRDDKLALIKRLEPFQIICTMRERTPFPRDLIANLPNLKLLLTTSGRNASLEVSALTERGIPVAGTTAEPLDPDSTTQHCVALILGIARNIAQENAAMKAGFWQTTLATNLTGRTFGAVGFGRLGFAVSKILKVAFNMKIIAWSTNLTQEAADEKARKAGLPTEDENGEKTFKVVSRDELFSTADVVNIQLVLSERSRGLINASDLNKMKKTALFINAARGPLVVQDDLLQVAKKGQISGIAIDVYDTEPLPVNSEWRTTRWGIDGKSRVLLTPHMGYVQDATIHGWYKQQVENILRWEKGEELAVQYKDNGY